MNNILLHNMIRRQDKKLEAEIAETIEIMKNGYRCTEKCVLIHRGLCRKMKECRWDLRSKFYRGAKNGSV